MKDRFKTIATIVPVTWILFFVAMPLLITFSLSLVTSTEHGLYQLTPTLKNFHFVFSGTFYKIFWRSCYYALLATFLCFLIAYPFSYHLSQLRHKKLLLGLILIPFWTNSLIRTYALIGLLKTKGLVNALLLKLGLTNQPLELLYNQVAMIIGLVYNLLPFMILPLYNTFEKMDRSLIKAGKDLNASAFYIFKHITWPLSLSGIKDGFIMTFFPAMTLFYIPTILGGAKSILLGNLIETQFLLLNDWPGGAASSLVLSLLLLVMIFILNRKQHL